MMQTSRFKEAEVAYDIVVKNGMVVDVYQWFLEITMYLGRKLTITY